MVSKETSEVQSVVFKTDPPSRWTADTSREWLDKHDFERMKTVDKTKNSLRYRIVSPKKFKSFTTKVIKAEMGNINLIIGRIDKKKKEVIKKPRASKIRKKGTIHFKSRRGKKN